ncbi:TPA: hypothetical protein KQG32_002989 [Clostridioides difficile]|nr:hypothetical protein [Clostridioides difficile]
MNDDKKTVKENTSNKRSRSDYIKIVVLLIFLMVLPLLAEPTFANIVGVQIFLILFFIIDILMKNGRR